MKRTLLLLFYLTGMLLTLNSSAQKVILLHCPGKQKHYFYKVGDFISVETGKPSFTLGGKIAQISDTFCLLENKLSFDYNKVHKVFQKRAFFKIFNAPKFIEASALYTGFSVINRSLNGEKPIFDNTIPVVVGSGLLVAFVSYKLRTKSLHTPKWKFKVLEF